MTFPTPSRDVGVRGAHTENILPVRWVLYLTSSRQQRGSFLLANVGVLVEIAQLKPNKQKTSLASLLSRVLVWEARGKKVHSHEKSRT